MENKHFEVIEKQGKVEQFKVIRDNQTGVLYMAHTVGAGTGLVALVDQEGKPLVDEDYLNSTQTEK